MILALYQTFPFILDKNLAKANCNAFFSVEYHTVMNTILSNLYERKDLDGKKLCNNNGMGI